ncbi:UDP-3-O-acyl-N-acetylglucosamine deacetylase [Desulforamulus aeronauticus]|uniref:UDP-3-O-acyl-N-acetylglucosamine deacetylase n=1 Tax=Desulforamulus aeronauticus DSM 10349 TaxID=1121421 RepID=A0A1M6TEC7_9FIRM|nr:UDP-3-O-acyl-N-acetylglucosamine deacetylase [Desulforamulus aeronauticus]SHK55239.1 UDP-3-O-[3-hydroxymyristoyl] N-acetylglucosamine deacetylase [Desulforamulus aeronauticus DSM 10349]
MQKTIKQPGSCSGISITGQTSSTVKFHPAPPDSGIVFVREDLPGQPEIPCRPEYVRVDSRWTSLVLRDIRIEHTEHLLAAIAGLGLDNLRIGLNNPSIPVVSSFSSHDFVRALLKAEPIFQAAPKKYIRVQEPLLVANSFYHQEKRYDRFLLALPAPQLSITYLLDYPNKEIPTQVAHYTLNQPSDFAAELAPARSYIIQSEFERVAGLIGENMQDCLIFPPGPNHVPLQWANEPARHKALDLLGDIFSMGQAVQGHFIGIRTGHKDNFEMCQKMKPLLRRNCS